MRVFCFCGIKNSLLPGVEKMKKRDQNIKQGPGSEIKGGGQVDRINRKENSTIGRMEKGIQSPIHFEGRYFQ